MNLLRQLAAFAFLSFTVFSQAAGLEFPERLKEIHATAQDSTVTVDFNFTNKGDRPVTIAKCDPSCSCMKVQISGGKLKYAPGESGVVRATMELGNLTGTQEKTIGLWLEKDPANRPSVKLDVRVRIPVLVSLEPKSVVWSIGAEPETKTIRIVMAEGNPIRVTRVSGTSDAVRYELKTVEEGRKYELFVTPLETKTPVMSAIRIETDCKIAKHRVQQAFAQIRKLTPAEAAANP
ncbi:MAG: DUF1573 domain-containing protein [Verrucomicrobiota bacterium]